MLRKKSISNPFSKKNPFSDLKTFSTRIILPPGSSLGDLSGHPGPKNSNFWTPASVIPFSSAAPWKRAAASKKNCGKIFWSFEKCHNWCTKRTDRNSTSREWRTSLAFEILHRNVFMILWPGKISLAAALGPQSTCPSTRGCVVPELAADP